MIEVKNLTKNFNGLTAVNDISFQVDEGELLAYLGPNGAGKTTTINILSTLLTPTSGSATVSGYDVVKEGKKIRPMIGYLPDDFGLYPSLTINQNLDFFGALYKISKSERKSRIEDLLEFFELYEKKKVLISCINFMVK